MSSPERAKCREERADVVIVEFPNSVEEGRHPDPDSLLARSPDLANNMKPTRRNLAAIPMSRD